eukprot:1811921-Prorocentrum_lima.AAC.1
MTSHAPVPSRGSVSSGVTAANVYPTSAGSGAPAASASTGDGSAAARAGMRRTSLGGKRGRW